jgi:Family of unknown function (DUF3836)
MDLTTITITAATILSLFGENTGKSNYLYKTEFTPKQIVCGKIIYENNDGYYRQFLHYIYKYDEQNRLQSKEVQTWNTDKNKWENTYCLNYKYQKDNQTVIHQNWNTGNNEYSDFIEKMEYQIIGESICSVTTHKWDNNQKDWAFVNRTAVYDPHTELLTNMEK